MDEFEIEVSEYNIHQCLNKKRYYLTIKENGQKLTKEQEIKLKEYWKQLDVEYDVSGDLDAETRKIYSTKRRILAAKFKSKLLEETKHLVENVDKYIELLDERITELKELSDDKRKENLTIYLKTIVKCDCGKETMRANLSRHKKSKKHIEWEQQQKQTEQELEEKKQLVAEQCRETYTLQKKLEHKDEIIRNLKAQLEIKNMFNKTI
jgi:hypothetical protein